MTGLIPQVLDIFFQPRFSAKNVQAKKGTIITQEIFNRVQVRTLAEPLQSCHTETPVFLAVYFMSLFFVNLCWDSGHSRKCLHSALLCILCACIFCLSWLDKNVSFHRHISYFRKDSVIGFLHTSVGNKNLAAAPWNSFILVAFPMLQGLSLSSWPTTLLTQGTHSLHPGFKLKPNSDQVTVEMEHLQKQMVPWT